MSIRGRLGGKAERGSACPDPTWPRNSPSHRETEVNSSYSLKGFMGPRVPLVLGHPREVAQDFQARVPDN